MNEDLQMSSVQVDGDGRAETDPTPPDTTEPLVVVDPNDRGDGSSVGSPS